MFSQFDEYIAEAASIATAAAGAIVGAYYSGDYAYTLYNNDNLEMNNDAFLRYLWKGSIGIISLYGVPLATGAAGFTTGVIGYPIGYAASFTVRNAARVVAAMPGAANDMMQFMIDHYTAGTSDLGEVTPASLVASVPQAIIDHYTTGTELDSLTTEVLLENTKEKVVELMEPPVNTIHSFFASMKKATIVAKDAVLEYYGAKPEVEGTSKKFQ